METFAGWKIDMNFFTTEVENEYIAEDLSLRIVARSAIRIWTCATKSSAIVATVSMIAWNVENRIYS